LGLTALLTREGLRRFLLIVLNKSTHPRTSPFTYFASLLSIATAIIGLLKFLLFKDASS
jgi:hypothetical protein